MGVLVRRVQQHQPVSARRPGPVLRAVYGSSRVLGGVEFLTARFGAHRFAPHSHPVFAIGAVQRGACRIWHRGTSHLAGPGDLILINPGDPHSADPATPDDWDYCAVYFSLDTAVHWRREQDAFRRGLRLRGVVGRDPALAASLSTLCRSLEHDPESAAGEAAFATFVGDLFRRFGDAHPVSDDADDASRTEVVRQYIEDNYATCLRIDTLAELTGQSPFRVIRSFTRRYGMPPYTYLTHVRVAHARAMLKQGRAISETAILVGFNDQSHLTKFFRRITGVPPGQFARALSEGTSAHRFAE